MKRYKSALWFTLLAAAIVTFSLAAVWLGDDIDYRYFISDSIWNSYGRLSSIPRFFASQGNHYMNVNGRFTAHALVQLFCGVAGKTAFAAANALIYCAFIYLVLKFAKVRRIADNPAAVITAITVTLLTFVTKMMPTTQIGFVWMFALNLAWLRLFINHRNTSRLGTLLIFILGISVGNGQEALTLGMSAALGLWWLHRRCRVGKARTAMLICYWAGTLAICCSPGTLGRAGGLSVPLGTSIVYMLLSLRAAYMLIITVIVLRMRGTISLRKAYRDNALFVNAMAIMLLFNLAIGVYCNRQLFGIELMAMLIMLRLLPQHAFARGVRIVAMLAVVVMLGCQWQGIRKVQREYDDIEALYAESEKGIVYYDRTLGSNNYYLREYRYYEEIVGQFNNDTHHSLQKLMHEKYPKQKSLHVWPTCIKGAKAVHDTVIEYAPQHFFAICLDSKEYSPKVYARGEATDITIEKSAVHGKGWHSMIILPHTPFSPIDSVTLQ